MPHDQRNPGSSPFFKEPRRRATLYLPERPLRGAAGPMIWLTANYRGWASLRDSSAGRFGMGFKSSFASDLLLHDEAHRLAPIHPRFGELRTQVQNQQNVLKFPGHTFHPLGTGLNAYKLRWWISAVLTDGGPLPFTDPTLPWPDATTRPCAAWARKPESARGQGQEQDSAVRQAVEQHAVARARSHYEAAGYAVTVVGKPYDLRVVRDGEERHVEVKGSRSKIEAVALTVNEVDHARSIVTDLVVVDQIVCTHTPDGLATRGGELRIQTDWRPADEDLTPTVFRYRLPQGMHRTRPR